MNYAYVIESEKTRRWYYGSSHDPHERLMYHNNGWNRSTRGRGPWRLIFLRDFQSEIEAREFEFQLKGLRNKEFIKKKFSKYFLSNWILGAPGLPR
jgi:putative endonuclease